MSFYPKAFRYTHQTKRKLCYDGKYISDTERLACERPVNLRNFFRKLQKMWSCEVSHQHTCRLVKPHLHIDITENLPHFCHSLCETCNGATSNYLTFKTGSETSSETFDSSCLICELSFMFYRVFDQWTMFIFQCHMQNLQHIYNILHFLLWIWISIKQRLLWFFFKECLRTLQYNLV